MNNGGYGGENHMIMVSGTDIKYFHEYSLKLRRAAEDEFAHQP